MPVIKAVQGPDFGNLLLQGMQTYRGVKQIEREGAQDAQTAEIRDLAVRAQNDPEAMRMLAALDPDRAYKMKQRQDYERDRFEKERAILASEIENLPLEAQRKALENRIFTVKKRGGDPSNTMGLYNLLSSGDPAQMKEGQDAITNARIQGEKQGILKPAQSTRPQEDTALGKNLKGAGLVPGSDAYKKEMMKQLRKGFDRPTELQRNMQLAGIDPQSEEGQKIIRSVIAGSKMKIGLDSEGNFTFASGIGVDGGDIVGPTKSTVTSLQKKQADNMMTLAGLAQTQSLLDKEFLTYGEKAKNWSYAQLEKFGIEQSPEVQDRIAKYNEFRSSATGSVSAYMKAMSGVAINPAEIKRIEKTFPTADDSYSQFKGKMKSVSDNLLLRNRILNDLIREGKTDNTANEVSKRFNAIQAGSGKKPDGNLRIQDLINNGITDKEERFNILKQEGYI